MAWTYSISTDIGKIRSRLGDTTSGASLTLTDEEIQEVLDEYAGVNLAAPHCARRLKARAVRLVSGGQISGDLSEVARQYDDLIKELTRVASVPSATSFGGVSQAAIDALHDEDDVAERPFSIGRDDNG